MATDRQIWRSPWWKWVIIIVLVCWGWWWWHCCLGPVTTVLVVRHAEKEAAPPDDPPLSGNGLARAQELVHVAEHLGVSAAFATQFQRTHQTVEPLASSLGLTIQVISASDITGLVDAIKTGHAGQTVVVAGHSDTVPQIVHALGAATPPAIPENEFDELFVVVVRGCTATATRLQYGAVSPAP